VPPEPLVPPLIANDARDVVGPIHLDDEPRLDTEEVEKKGTLGMLSPELCIPMAAAAAASTTLAPRACWLGGARGPDRLPAERFWTPAWLSRRWIRLHALSPWERALLHSQDAGEGK